VFPIGVGGARGHFGFRSKRVRTTTAIDSACDAGCGKGYCQIKLASQNLVVFTMAKYPQLDTPTESQIKSKAPFRDKAGEELREFIVLAAYLYVCFAAVIYFKAAVLQAHGIAYAHLGLAITKAAICAKFMLMGRAFHLGEWSKNLPLIVPTLHRSFVFLLLLAVLTFIEEIVVGVIHGRTVLDSISGIAGGTFQQMIATTLIIFLILVPYFAFRALGEIVGDKTLVRLFFERRHNA
jgi:hypothetical protein